jgi:glutamine amidotransferase-like uncharacterized protein
MIHLLLLLIGTAAPLSASNAELALVYKGAGTCAKGCAEAAAYVARRAGFETRYVGEEPLPAELLERAKVWIQPGGRVETQELSMKPELKRQLQDFVRSGKGYVGFCAGAFLAADTFGWLQKDGTRFDRPGLGLFRGKGRLYQPQKTSAEVLPVYREGKKVRSVYWELGSYFQERDLGSAAEPLASYDRAGKHVAALRSSFGGGRVSVTGYHPEAPSLWRKLFGLFDPDGVDYDEAEAMIQWAAGQGE